MMALDDFGPGDARESLVQFADFIKVDIRKTAPEEVATWSAGTVVSHASCWH